MIITSKILILMLQSISGGVAGYITNKYAVNMLFKEYTPFKLGEKVLIPLKFGGVVKNNKEKFVSELSNLVERDIINGKTLKSQISSDVFKEEINNISHMFFYKTLNETFGKTRLKDISGFKDTKDNLISFTEENLKGVVTQLIENFIDNFNLQSLLDDSQIFNIAETLSNLIEDEIKNNKDISTLIVDLYEENSKVFISDILSKDSKKIINQNISMYIASIIEDIFKDKEKLVEVLDKICEISKIDSVIDNFQKTFKEKQLNELISDEECKILSKKVFKKMNDYIHTENEISIIENLLNNFIEEGKKIDFTIYEILPEEASNKISEFIENSVSKFLPYIASWVLQNKEELNLIIEDSIDEAIGNLDGSIKKMIISKIKSFFSDDLSENAGMAGKIAEYIENYKIDEESSENLSNIIINYLKNTKIKEIVLKLEINNLINENMIKRISNFIINEFSIHGESLIHSLLKDQLSKNIGEVIKNDLSEWFSISGKSKLYTYLFNNKKHYLHISKELILKAFNRKYDEFLNNTISDVISKEDVLSISANVNSYLGKSIKKNKGYVEDTLKDEIQKLINNLDLKEEIKNNRSAIEKFFIDEIINIEEKEISKYEEIKLSEILYKIPNKSSISSIVATESHKKLNDNLEDILEGKVKKVIYNNLIKFNEDEICDLAQRFMGNELQPLSIFGGILGVIVGLIYGVFTTNVDVSGFYTSAFSIITSCITMGLIGVMTNVIALKMLFRPYKKNKLVAKIPFFKHFALGYIPAHKENLASGIGNVIDNELLNGLKLKNLFKSKEDNFRVSLINYIENNNYKVVVDFINKKKKEIGNSIYKSLMNYIEKNSSQVSENISNKALNIKLKTFIKIDALNKLISKIEDNKVVLSTRLANHLENKLNSPKTISGILPNSILVKIEESLEDQITTYIKENHNKIFEEEAFKAFILNSNDSYSSFINKTLSEILDTETINIFRNASETRIKSFINNDFKIYANAKIQSILSSEIDEEKTIENVFNNNISILINKNLYKLSNYLINKSITYLANNKELVSTKVKEEINNHLNFLEKGIYLMAGGNNIVDNCVNIIIDNKVPTFINDKFFEVTKLIENALSNTLYKSKIKDLKIKASEIKTQEIFNNIFEQLSKTNKLQKQIDSITDSVFEAMFNTKLINILTVFNLENIDNVYEKFNEEINIIRNELSINVSKNINEVAEYSKVLIKENLNENIRNLEISEIFNNVKNKDIQYSVNFILSTLSANENFKNKTNDIIKDFYNNKLKYAKLKNFVNEDMILCNIKNAIRILSKDEELYIKGIEELNNECMEKNSDSKSNNKTKKYNNNDIERINNIINFNRKNQEVITKIIGSMVNNKFDFISMDTKKYLTEKVVDAALVSVIEHTTDILKKSELKKITSEQIEIMDSREIENLFDSFAGDFFKKLYMYGSFGAIFGVNLYLPIIWGAIEYINDKKN